MIKTLQKGFTLIELLVVITIIGILATGAVTTFTSQIQKARDTTRISDMKAVQGGVEQYYQDDGRYPTKGTSFSGVTLYVAKLPKDPKNGEATTNTAFEYFYNVADDDNGIPEQEYELSGTFENGGNLTKKAATDGGDDDFRLEIGIDLDDTTDKPTVVTGAVTGNLYACVAPAG